MPTERGLEMNAAKNDIAAFCSPMTANAPFTSLARNRPSSFQPLGRALDAVGQQRHDTGQRQNACDDALGVRRKDDGGAAGNACAITPRVTRALKVPREPDHKHILIFVVA